jgi:hypothetical protein
LAAEPAAPIDKRSAIQRHVIGVSALSRRASAALSVSPLRRILNSSSFHPSRRAGVSSHYLNCLTSVTLLADYAHASPVASRICWSDEKAPEFK